MRERSWKGAVHIEKFDKMQSELQKCSRGMQMKAWSRITFLKQEVPFNELELLSLGILTGFTTVDKYLPSSSAPSL